VDSLGRATRTSDPDLGVWTATYDAGSRLVTRTDAKGTVTSMTYDVLGRVLTKTVDTGTAAVKTTSTAACPGEHAVAGESRGPARHQRLQHRPADDVEQPGGGAVL
jgi:YD repeat-containing protein